MKSTFVYNMKIKTRQQITALFDLSWESMCQETPIFHHSEYLYVSG